MHGQRAIIEFMGIFPSNIVQYQT